MGRGAGQVVSILLQRFEFESHWSLQFYVQEVSVLAFFSNDTSSNPAEDYSFLCKNLCFKRTKINKKVAGLGRFLFRYNSGI